MEKRKRVGEGGSVLFTRNFPFARDSHEIRNSGTTREAVRHIKCLDWKEPIISIDSELRLRIVYILNSVSICVSSRALVLGDLLYHRIAFHAFI